MKPQLVCRRYEAPRSLRAVDENAAMGRCIGDKLGHVLWLSHRSPTRNQVKARSRNSPGCGERGTAARVEGLHVVD